MSLDEKKVHLCLLLMISITASASNHLLKNSARANPLMYRYYENQTINKVSENTKVETTLFSGTPHSTITTIEYITTNNIPTIDYISSTTPSPTNTTSITPSTDTTSTTTSATTTSSTTISPTTISTTISPPTTFSTTIVPPITSSTTIVPPTTSSTTIVPPTTSSTTIVPPTTSSTTIVPPTISSTTIVPPTTSSSTIVPPTTSSTTIVSPTTSSTTIVPPTTSSTTVVPPTTSFTTIVPPTTSSTTIVPPTTSSTTIVPPTTSSTTIVPPTTSSTTIVPPTTPSTTIVPPTISSSTIVPPTTSSTTIVPPTTSSTTIVPPTTSSTTIVPPTTSSTTYHPTTTASTQIPTSSIPITTTFTPSSTASTSFISTSSSTTTPEPPLSDKEVLQQTDAVLASIMGSINEFLTELDKITTPALTSTTTTIEAEVNDRYIKDRKWDDAQIEVKLHEMVDSTIHDICNESISQCQDLQNTLLSIQKLIDNLQQNPENWQKSDLDALREQSNDLSVEVKKAVSDKQFMQETVNKYAAMTVCGSIVDDVDNAKNAVDEAIHNIEKAETNGIVFASVFGTIGGLIVVALIVGLIFSAIKSKRNQKGKQTQQSSRVPETRAPVELGLTSHDNLGFQRDGSRRPRNDSYSLQVFPQRTTNKNEPPVRTSAATVPEDLYERSSSQHHLEAMGWSQSGSDNPILPRIRLGGSSSRPKASTPDVHSRSPTMGSPRRESGRYYH